MFKLHQKCPCLQLAAEKDIICGAAQTYIWPSLLCQSFKTYHPLLTIMFESAANAQLKRFKNDRQKWIIINVIFLVKKGFVKYLPNISQFKNLFKIYFSFGTMNE